ncbi:hypothetical protein [Orrella dioscoreae]|uniref:Uncharacterized protein n=1 Tax=Orrella dioscoreae TaxID=1851544 RepID=A0A1C3K5G8_9BURK|nr:hypothetical protein [Orrella dioscoreae]SBT26732.1 hypothetical protein ODI_01627 [Orrella dioscoreae]SOE48052.1 hypothetical protein ODI_R1206 [Orrella dioscoreae]
MQQYLPILALLVVAGCAFSLGWMIGLAHRKPHREIERLENAIVRARWALARAVTRDPALQADYDALDAVQIKARPRK